MAPSWGLPNWLITSLPEKKGNIWKLTSQKSNMDTKICPFLKGSYLFQGLWFWVSSSFHLPSPVPKNRTPPALLSQSLQGPVKIDVGKWDIWWPNQHQATKKNIGGQICTWNWAKLSLLLTTFCSWTSWDCLSNKKKGIYSTSFWHHRGFIDGLASSWCRRIRMPSKTHKKQPIEKTAYSCNMNLVKQLY